MKMHRGTFLAAWAGLMIISTSVWAQRPERSGGPPGRGGEPRPGERGNPLFRLLDANRDGSISAEEIQGAATKLQELDKNKDSKLVEDELRDLFPFGPGRPGGPGGPPGGPGRGFGPGGGENLQFGSEPLAMDEQEKKILTALNQMRQGARYANVSTNDGRLLRMLTETVGAKRVVEIGTSTGESGVWFALALRSTGGHLFTHEIDEERAKVAEENFRKAGVNELVTIILGDAHETVKQHKDPIDILFLDADKEGYIDYLDKLVPLVRPGGLIIAHNMNPRQADQRYVDAITKNPQWDTSFLLMEGAGVGVTMKKR